MGRRILYCLLIAAVCLTSCARRERVIPRGKMAKIYAEMFVADQRIFTQGQPFRAMADTSWVYEPIFEKYGYTSDDYRASVAYYIKDANRFARILRSTGTVLEGQLKDLKKQKRLLELQGDAESQLREYAPEKIFYMTSVRNPNTMGADTLIYFLDANGGKPLFEPRDWESPTYYGPERTTKSVQRRAFGEKLSNGRKTFNKTNSSLPSFNVTSGKDKDSNADEETTQKGKAKKAARQSSSDKPEATTQPAKSRKSVKQDSQDQTENTQTEVKPGKTKSGKTGKTEDTQTELKKVDEEVTPVGKDKK